MPLDEINLENGDHVTDKYSIKKVEDIEKQNNQLKEEVSVGSSYLMDWACKFSTPFCINSPPLRVVYYLYLRNH